MHGARSQCTLASRVNIKSRNVGFKMIHWDAFLNVEQLTSQRIGLGYGTAAQSEVYKTYTKAKRFM